MVEPKISVSSTASILASLGHPKKSRSGENVKGQSDLVSKVAIQT